MGTVSCRACLPSPPESPDPGHNWSQGGFLCVELRAQTVKWCCLQLGHRNRIQTPGAWGSLLPFNQDYFCGEDPASCVRICLSLWWGKQRKKGGLRRTGWKLSPVQVPHLCQDPHPCCPPAHIPGDPHESALEHHSF